MTLETMKQNYEKFEQAVDLLQKDLDVSYLDAIIETGDNLIEGGQLLIENGKPSPDIRSKLMELYQQLTNQTMPTDEMRQIIQFALLKANQIDKIQANHQMTPDMIGFLIEYVMEKFLSKDKEYKLLDISVGTGNLLSSVFNKLKLHGYQPTKLYGIDNDDTLLAVASMSARLQKISAEFIHQDAIDNLVIPKVDIVVSDLPVGYYPVDKKVVNFETHSEEGHSYVHHLLIEQSLQQLVPGGYAFFVVPRGLFETKETQKLLSVIRKQAYFQGMLDLPDEFFSNKNYGKALLFLQKHGGGAKQVQQVLIGTFPSLKAEDEFTNFLGRINSWADKNLD
ncbi:class I SAM-dependent methyltransferase [Liquorilactobacillus capillatus]|uniref:Adenine-specific DNA methylase n=1 Tax=Liquorilactobacillus capillatus DSM 19910 TaxID=1423731 RepID=A0A0R1MC95_9LACO|nr:class I SAM-dependent methyltransferase [Liquorilactobacillus capillatus]KRL02722.1 adenine-specific DNA methylase [Liquorilactobacillus capillatus DSM 19910]